MTTFLKCQFTAGAAPPGAADEFHLSKLGGTVRAWRLFELLHLRGGWR
ncbi:hypothetical protein [Pseudomonas cavernae]|nr:hypothetical protein [Pseudomonas cavernae]